MSEPVDAVALMVPRESTEGRAVSLDRAGAPGCVKGLAKRKAIPIGLMQEREVGSERDASHDARTCGGARIDCPRSECLRR